MKHTCCDQRKRLKINCKLSQLNSAILDLTKLNNTRLSSTYSRAKNIFRQGSLLGTLLRTLNFIKLRNISFIWALYDRKGLYNLAYEPLILSSRLKWVIIKFLGGRFSKNITETIFPVLKPNAEDRLSSSF